MSVTIKDIANLAGVSYSTVSKALNDSPLVKNDTKVKIVKIANDMGYEPNFAAQRLVSKQTKTIGLIWPTIERVVLSTLVTKINEEISQTPYSMILAINSIQSSLDLFKRFQVDGIIVFEENVDVQIDSNPIPILSYGVADEKPYPIIDANHEEAMYEAIKYLYGLSHKQIAYIGDFSPLDPRQMEKYEGFKRAMDEFGLTVNDDNLINTGGLDWYDGYAATDKLLNSSYRPTAIVGGSYDISDGIIRGIKEHNLIVPKDISIISYDNIPQMSNMEIPLTCIGVPADKLASEIVNSVIRLIENKDLEPFVKKMKPILTERNSCAPAVLT